MITIYTTCRSFANQQFSTIQHNAIGSWLTLRPKPQIIIVGNDDGAEEACKKYGCDHIPNVPVSESNAPILSKMMAEAEKYAHNKLLLLVSSDIILFPDTIQAAELLQKKLGKFCAGLLKQDIADMKPIDFTDYHWDQKLKKEPRQSGGWGGDYYLHTKGFWENAVPAFSIGRTYCDNWLYWYAFNKDALVDLSKSVLIIHQKHGYAHVGQKRKAVSGEESIKNKQLAGQSVQDPAHVTTIAWANWELDEEKRLRKRRLTKCEIDNKGNRIYEYGYGEQ